MSTSPEKKQQYIFGPIISRRLGVSLGIDLIPPKTCNLDCVYCECGRTTNLTATRDFYIDPQAIINELDAYLQNNPPHIDIITFAGSGEPTLNRGLKTISDHIKNHYPQYQRGILTNSAALIDEEVRETLLDFDIVLPSVDALFESSFQQINRPAEGITCAMILEGVSKFMEKYQGIVWVEYFVLPGVNDSVEELAAFKDFFTKTTPHRVQLNSLDRPGTCSWVQPAPLARLQEIEKFFQPLPVEIISRSAKEMVLAKPSQQDVDKLVHTIARRPLTVEDIATLHGMSINEATMIAEQLVQDGRLEKSIIAHRTFLKVIE